jgi:hypothetical protein
VTSRFDEQIAAYCLSALAGGTMFYLWRRLGKDDRRRVWRLYGWFSGLMMCGSCFGVVTWVARMVYFINFYESGDANLKGNLAEANSFMALHSVWRAVFNVAYAIDFLCLSAAKLMVLDRLSDFAAPQGEDKRKRWFAGGRIVMAVVVLGNAIGLAGNFAATVQFQKAAEAYSTASAYFVANNTNDGSKHAEAAQTYYQFALNVSSVQRFCEVTVLLLILAAFALVGIMSVRLVSSSLTLLVTAGPEVAAGMMLTRHQTIKGAQASGRQFRRQLVVTTAFVFVAFLLRSLTATMLAVALLLQDSGHQCPGVSSLCDASCYNSFTHYVYWNFYTPEYRPTVYFIASPLALLVALWGMTSKRTLQLMKKTSTRDTVEMRAL